MKNASTEEKKVEEIFNEAGYVVYRSEEDPGPVAKEAMNLERVYGRILDFLGELGLIGYISSWGFRNKEKGYYDFDPSEGWIGKNVIAKVGERQIASGVIKAVKRVGNWYIPGVEFDFYVPGGHGLSYRDSGNPGKEESCLWVLLEDVEFIH